jgi:AcrR family transcriptional regulator
MGQRIPLLRARMRDAAADVMLEAAERIMRDKGYAGATMQDIAAAAGCAVGTLYLHFKNKEELLRGILLKHGTSLTRDMYAALEGISDPLEKLRVFITAHLRWAHEHPAITELVGKALPMRYYDFQAGLSRIVPEEHSQMQSVELAFIAEAQAAGRIRADISAAALAELVDGFMFTVMDQFSARPNAYNLQQQIDITWAFLTSGLQGGRPAATGHRTPSNSHPRKSHV